MFWTSCACARARTHKAIVVLARCNGINNKSSRLKRPICASTTPHYRHRFTTIGPKNWIMGQWLLMTMPLEYFLLCFLFWACITGISLESRSIDRWWIHKRCTSSPTFINLQTIFVHRHCQHYQSRALEKGDDLSKRKTVSFLERMKIIYAWQV